MTRRSRVLVTGAGGFIGHHLAASLKQQGYWVRGIDVKAPANTRRNRLPYFNGRKVLVTGGAGFVGSCV